ncbi:MAG: hypothetical protein AAGF48_12915 [Pseudomonadota bacterium]
MARNYQYPKGPLVKGNGTATLAAHGYLVGLEEITKDINGVENLDGETSYTNDELRDKLIAVIAALQG